MSTTIVILAAGQGKRMHSALPKVLQPLAGKPLLAHVIDYSSAAGADDICVVYGHGGDAVRSAFSEAPIRWALQAEQNGTGHAVQQAMPETPDDNVVIVVYGDIPLLTPGTLRELLDGCGPGEVGLLTVDLDNPFGYGRIIRQDGSIQRSVEERDATDDEKQTREVNTGVHVLCGRAVEALARSAEQ